MKSFATGLQAWNLLALKCALVLVCCVGLFFAPRAFAEEIGEVSTTFKVLGANDKIVIEAFDDPDIPGATCYVSRAKTGGITGSLGVAEDKANASISCRQTGPITLPERIAEGRENGRQVFRKSTSLLFKKLQVVRYYDKKRHTLIYLSYSDKIIDGSPENSISTIALAVPDSAGLPAIKPAP